MKPDCARGLPAVWSSRRQYSSGSQLGTPQSATLSQRPANQVQALTPTDLLAGRPGTDVASALRDGEDETLVAQGRHRPADGIPAHAVLLGQRGLGGQRVQMSKGTGTDLAPQNARELRVQRLVRVLIDGLARHGAQRNQRRSCPYQ